MSEKINIHSLIFEHSDDAVAVISLADARFVDANKKFCEFVGRNRDELVGSQWSLIAGIADPDLIKSKIGAYSTKIGISVFAAPHIKAKLISAQNKTFILIIIEEMTEPKLAQLKSEWRAEELEALIDSIPAAVWIAHDEKAKDITCNQVARDWLIRLDIGSDKASDVELGQALREATVQANGAPFHASKSPITRAARGEVVNNFEGAIRLSGGQLRYVLGNARPLIDAYGKPKGAVSVFVDITDLKRAEARELLLAREVDHRARNLLSVIQALIQLTRADTVASFKSRITGRVQSLATAHTLLADSRWHSVDLRKLVEEELRPFGFGDPKTDEGKRLSVNGPDIALTPAAAQSMALILHELATNCAKYGALHNLSGKLRIDWDLMEGHADTFALSWWEYHSTAAAPADQNGFGATVIRTSVEDQLRGRLLYHYSDDG
ncbi:MAG: hypothetical protein RLZZ561_1367, partial [Pseudomonadota bacterium]